jgi:hypothetical protein
MAAHQIATPVRQWLIVFMAGMVLTLTGCPSLFIAMERAGGERCTEEALSRRASRRPGGRNAARREGLPLHDFHRNKDGIKTPLMAAAEHGHLEVVKVLLDRGARPGQADGTGATALHYAARSGSGEVVDLLLARGVDINAGANRDSGTPLHSAGEGGATGDDPTINSKGS